jgi:hypothetical protein
VHLVPPPLELCLDARGVGGEGRWVRSGCHPNAVLRPVVCDTRKRKGKGKEEADAERESAAQDGAGADADECGPDAAMDGVGVTPGDDDSDSEVTFGVFAIRDLKAEEEIVLGWEWDDRHVVHELPRLLREGYGNGT